MAAQVFPNTKQDLIASLVQRELEFATKLLPTITNVSQYAVPGAKSISFPKLTSYVVQDRAFGAVDPEQVLTDSTDIILLDKNKIVSWIVDDADDVQSTINAVAESAKRSSAAIGRQIDNDIAAVLESDGRATTTAGVITRDIVLEMRQTLFDAEADESQMVFVVGNDSEADLLKIAEFTRNDIYGSNEVIKSGKMGTLYGMPVIRRSGLAAGSYYMYDAAGAGIGFQRNPNMESQQKIEYGTRSRLFAMDMLYGVDSLQRGLKGAAANESALIVKDNN